MNKFPLRFSPPVIITISVFLLNLLGLLALYSSLHRAGEFTEYSFLYKQLLWLILSWLVMIALSFVNYRFYYQLTYFVYIVVLFLLIVVELFGRTIMGAQRWISVMGLNLQPSELAKIAAIFILARSFSYWRFNLLRGFVFPFGLIFLLFLIIFKQPDLGTALIILFLFFIMGFSCGLKKRYLFILIISGLAFSPFAFNLLKDYQKKRLMVFLNPNLDPLGAGYTIIQSKIAIGSGRLWGKGFLSGTQNQFNFLPERHTDFIFTVIAEEWGFVGASLLFLFFWIILRMIISSAQGFKDPYAQALSFGIASLIFLHVFINIGMTLGVLPVVGLPLLFISYGGTHLLSSFILLGIFFNIFKQQSTL